MIEDITRIAFAGDWHGNFRYARKALKYASRNNADVVVHVGDFGVWQPYHFITAIGEEAERLGLVVLFVDGNHEDFTWLLHQPVDEDGVRRLHPNVWHLPRGFRWEWQGLRFLALGGAFSVDKEWRDPYVSWWPEETITVADMFGAVAGGEVDVMITHDCPNGVDIPMEESGLTLTESVLSQAEAHRYALGAVVDEVTPRFLFHGHYHTDYSAVRVHEDNERDCYVYGLNKDQTELWRNVKVVEVVDLIENL